MRRILHIAICVFGLILLWGCSRNSLGQGEEKTALWISIRVPQEMLSKAEIGEIPSSQDEKTVKRLQIWVFRHSDGEIIGYLDPKVNNLQSGITQKYSVFIDDAIAKEMPQVDVYALANGESAGLNFDGNTSRSVLDAANLAGEQFGTDSPVNAVPEGGLPFSGVKKDVSMSGSYPVLEIETVTISRVVSKIRLLLCKQNSDLVNEFILEGISLNGEIGTEERIFTTSTYSGSSHGDMLFDIMGGSYSSLSYNFPIPASIPAYDYPGEFSYRSVLHTTESPAEYEKRIDAAVADHRLASAGTLYFRETDKKLSGTISYRIGAGGTLKHTTFEMASEGDFIRNHCWIIYAYFLSGKLYVKPTLLPWIAGHDIYNHTTQGSVEMLYNRYLRYDEDKNSSTWNDTYVSVAYGFENGIPRFAPMVTLNTNSTNNLLLQVNNEDFQFIKKSGSSYSAEGQSILIVGKPDDQITEFYLVPISADTPTDPVAKVMLTELPAGGLPPVNTPFNHDLPGEEDHTVIIYYNIGAATYSANQYNAKQTGEMQTSQYWIEEIE